MKIYNNDVGELQEYRKFLLKESCNINFIFQCLLYVYEDMVLNTFGDVEFGGALTNAFLWTEGETREFRFDFFEAFALFGPLLSSTHQTFVTV